MWQPLRSATSQGDECAFDYWIAKGARTDLFDSDGRNLLHVAAASAQLNLIAKLLALQVDLNKRDRKGNTSLAAACDLREFGVYDQSDDDYAAITEMLLNAGSDPNSRNKQGQTPLMLASWSGRAACVRTLLDYKAELHSLDAKGNSALLLASDFGRTEVIEILVTHGAEINVANLRGNTPLMLAAENGDARSVKLLLSQGAVLGAKDRKGRTALDRCHRVNVGPLLGAEAPPDSHGLVSRATQIDYALYSLILADLRRVSFRPWQWSQRRGGAGPVIVNRSVVIASWELGNFQSGGYQAAGLTVDPSLLADAYRRNRRAVSFVDMVPRFEARVLTPKQVNRIYAKEQPTKENPAGKQSDKCILKFRLPGYAPTGDSAVVFLVFADGRRCGGGGHGVYNMKCRDGVWQVDNKGIWFYA